MRDLEEVSRGHLWGLYAVKTLDGLSVIMQTFCLCLEDSVWEQFAYRLLQCRGF